MKVIDQLCIKSIEFFDEEKDATFKVEQGKQYTTSVPSDEKEEVILFSRYWVGVPKGHFVPVEAT